MLKLTRLMIVIMAFLFQSITVNVSAATDDQIALLNEWLNASSGKSGCVEDVRELIGRGAKVNALTRGCAPLHYAAWCGRVDIVRELIGYEADVNVRDYREEAPLHYAVRGGYIDIVRELIGYGADVNLSSGGGNTPLHRAAQTGKFEVAKILLALGADAEKKNRFGETPADIAQENGYDDLVTFIRGWNDIPDTKGVVTEDQE